jgi:hypothetical protein
MPFKKIEVTRPRGINSDLSPYEMPNELWSNGNNVDFKGARVNVALGYQRVLTTSSMSVIPKHAVAFKDGSTDYWYYAGDTKIYKTDGTNHINVTRQTNSVDEDYTPEFDITYAADGETVVSKVRQHSGWTSNVFNGALLLNNGYDLPQVYSTNTSKMVDLTAWPSTDKCGVLRPFKNYLVALDITEGSNRRPTMVKWSDTAPLGEVPASWTAVDASSQAGYNILPDTQGQVLEGKALGDTFFIYKNDAVWAMQFIGGNFVFSFRKVFSDVGILAKDCVAEYDNKHFVVGVDDVYVHDGTTKKSVISNKMQEFFYNDINTDHVSKVRCVANNARKEMIIYYPNFSSENGIANTAITWNWESDSWSKRDIGNISHITTGLVSEDTDGRSWGADTGTDTWEGSTGVWDTQTYNPAVNSLVYISQGLTPQLSSINLGNSGLEIRFPTTRDTYESFVEREGIDFGDDKGYKYVHAIYPHMVGEGTIKIYVGTEEFQGGGISWSQPQEFVVGQDYKVNFRKSGRYIAVRFEGDGGSLWGLTGYSMEYSLEGRQ